MTSDPLLDSPSDTSGRRSAVATPTDWLGSTHPVPSFVVASLTTVFAWGVGLEMWQVMVVFAAMLANQTGIGLGNDWCDAAQDRAVGRGDKPIAAGRIPPRQALIVALGLGATALALGAVLGVWAFWCQAVMLAAGWWYNLHAKGHWSSPLSYLVGFGLTPVFPSLGLAPPALPVWWVIGVAGALGLSAHFANALPDLLDDKHAGIRGLPQRLGPKASGIVLAAGVVSATALIAVFGQSLPTGVRVVTAALAVAASIIAAGLAFTPTPSRIIFPLLMGSAAVSVVAIVLDMAAR